MGIVTLLTGVGSLFLHQWEHHLQTLFFELRGPQPAPDDVVILAIDSETLSQAEYYERDPETYAVLAPIEKWPWRREAYAIVIERLMEAGAKAIALDVTFPTESSYGAADDEALATVLEKYSDRVALAMQYEEEQLRQGDLLKPTLPIPQFLETGVQLGTINVPIALDGRIHQQHHTYIKAIKARNADLDTASTTATDWDNIQSFSEAVLKSAQLPYDSTIGTDIRFLGPAGTFEQIPFWYVLDPDPWQNYLNAGEYFKDKIVLVGATAKILQDFHDAPFSGTLLYPEALPGVEILANDLVTLRDGRALKELIPLVGPKPAGLVLAIGIGLIAVLRTKRRTLPCLIITAAMASGWLVVSFVGFVGFGLMLPTASVTLAVVGIGSYHTGSRLILERFRKQRLRDKLFKFWTSPIVQEIISDEEDFSEFLDARQAQVVGSMLGGRYEVVEVLGSGGFSETYTAIDTQLPRQPICVVKQLRIVSDDPNAHQLAHRLFVSEAETLEQLGHHSQIPMLLAHFETGSAFYLVEEMVHGTTLKAELSSRQPKSQAWAMNFLLDILPVVEFVHSQGVIHRDIKPSNMIRRSQDNRVVLIDFGSVKQISNRIAESENDMTSTIGIGTRGYMPSEQSAGLPRFSSDLYAIGVTVIEALTGLSPEKMAYDDRGELIWQYRVPELDSYLADVLNRMVRYDFSQRYASVGEVLAALRESPIAFPSQMPAESTLPVTVPDDGDDDDEPWDAPTGFLPTDWMTNSADSYGKD